jgi:hypothetical protein
MRPKRNCMQKGRTFSLGQIGSTANEYDTNLLHMDVGH